MRSEDYYAPGSYNDPSAPWNQSEPPEKDFDVVISQTLSKSTEVTTTNYIYTEDVEYDDEGGKFLVRDLDTSDTNWKEAFEESNHYTPLQLIELFKKHLETELERMGDLVDKHRYQHLIEECDNWCMDDIEIFEDK